MVLRWCNLQNTLVSQFPKVKILDALEALIWQSNVIASVGVLAKTIDLLRAENVSFLDAHTAAVAVIHYDGVVLSYDRDFDRFPEISRVES